MDLGFRVVLWAMIPGLAFLVIFAVGRPLFIDDTHSTYHSFGGFGGVVDSLRSDSHPPLYFMFLAAWMRIAGMSEVALRLPSIAFCLASAYALWAYGTRTGDARLGLMFAVFYVFNPVVVDHLHTVRPYALAGLLATLSTIAYLRLAEGDGQKEALTAWGYVGVNVLGTLTHYWFFLLLAGHGLGVILAVRGRQALTLVVGIALSVIPFIVLWAPVFFEQASGAPTSWMSRPEGLSWLLATPVRLAGGHLVLALAVYALTLVACVLRPGRPTGTIRWPEAKRILQDRTLWRLAAIPVTVFTLAFALSQIEPVYHLRYTIVVTPAFAMLLGLVLHRAADRRLWALVPLVVILGSVAIRDHGDFAYNLERDSRAVSEYLIDEYEEGDEVLHVTLSYAPTLHYLGALAPERTFSQTVFPREIAEHPGWRDPEAMVADSAALRREAGEVVTQFAARPVDARVWLLADAQRDTVLTRMLIEELEREFALRRVRHIQAWWVSEVSLYERLASPDMGGPGPNPPGPVHGR
jgi:hypothetical protein